MSATQNRRRRRLLHNKADRSRECRYVRMVPTFRAFHFKGRATELHSKAMTAVHASSGICADRIGSICFDRRDGDDLADSTAVVKGISVPVAIRLHAVPYNDAISASVFKPKLR